MTLDLGIAPLKPEELKKEAERHSAQNCISVSKLRA